MNYKVGDKVMILYSEERDLIGKVGTITLVDDMGQIHGTWSGVAISEEYGDKFEIIERSKS